MGPRPSLRNYPGNLVSPRTICTLAIVAIFSISFSTFQFIKTQVQKDLRKSLETVLASTSDAVSQWASGQRFTVEALALEPLIHLYIDGLLALPPDPAALINSPHQQSLLKFLLPIVNSPSYEGYFILNRDNISVASSRSSNIGVTNLLTQMPETLAAAWAGKTVVSSPLRSDVPLPDKFGTLKSDRETMFVLTPMRNAQGEVKAVFILRLNPFHTFTSLFTHGRLGESGETYAIDRNGFLVSESRFNDHLETIGLIGAGETPVMNIQVRDPGRNLLASTDKTVNQSDFPLTLMAGRVMSEQSNGYQVDGYRDYRGVRVIGAWAWLEKPGVGVATEIDFDEAYASLRPARYFVFGSALALTILSLLLLRAYLAIQEQTRLATESASQAIGADRLKSEFLSTMSHEIRTPMNGVLGMLSLLRASNLSEKSRGQADIAHKSAENLLRLLNDILDYTKLESGQLDLESIAWSPLSILEGVKSLLRPEAKAKGIELTGSISEDVPHHVLGDPDRVRQVLTNLVHNGIKFTSQGTVDINVSLVSPPSGVGDEMLFEVTDTGPGMTDDVLAMIFERFQQADRSTTRIHGGSGLGLAISRQLVEMMGGTIDVESAPGKGSRFTFTLPVIRAEAPACKPVQEKCFSRLSLSPKILLADDDQASRVLVAELLHRFDIEPDIVENGIEAVEKAETGEFDLILMDVAMPYMDGIEATSRIRNMTGLTAETPILGLTAHALSAQIQTYLDRGMTGVVTKPLTSDTLFEAMEEALGRHSAAQRS